MKRSKVKNKANKTKNPLDIMNFKKQRNYVTKLNRKAKLGGLKLGNLERTYFLNVHKARFSFNQPNGKR